MVERGAAPARAVRNRASGTPRVAVRSNYVGLASMPGLGQASFGESRRDRGRKRSATSQEAWSRGAKSPQWSAARRRTWRYQVRAPKGVDG